MRPMKKSEMIADLERVINLTVNKAKSVHRHYMQAIRDGDVARQNSESELRDELLRCARMMKNVMLPHGRKIYLSVFLYKVRTRRLKREEAARCSN